MSTIKQSNRIAPSPDQKIRLPFALPIIEGKKLKKKCCKKYKKGKQCRRCPKGLMI